MRAGWVIVIVLLVACENPKKAQIDQLADDAIEVHDEVMPMTDELYYMRKELQKRVQEDSTLLTDSMASVIKEIKDAEDSMWDWMRNFNLHYEGENDDSTIAYFTRQKKDAELVAEQMKKAQLAGEKKLKEIE